MAAVEQLQSIDPYEFEQLIADLWESKGYRATVRQKSQDRGIDIEAEKGGQKVVIQVKRYSTDNKIGSEEVRKYATLYQQTNANSVVIVTSGYFTDSARELADDLQVELVNGDQVVQQLKNNDVSSGVETPVVLPGSTSEKERPNRSHSTESSGGLLGMIAAGFLLIIFLGVILQFAQWLAGALSLPVSISVETIRDATMRDMVVYVFLPVVILWFLALFSLPFISDEV